MALPGGHRLKRLELTAVEGSNSSGGSHVGARREAVAAGLASRD